MCGIAGTLTVADGSQCERLVRQVIASQIARGPDAQAVMVYANRVHHACLGHDRLSIIDLSADANQPMALPDDSLAVVYNGEVYNYVELRAELRSLGHSFRTQSDTEVVLAAYHQWGLAAFDRFIGMFALGLYDAEMGEILLVRDRFGVKPLYYWSNGLTLAFASTPTVLAQWARRPANVDYVARGIRYKFYEDETDITPYDGIRAVRPAHWVKARAVGGRIAISSDRYYDLSERALARSDALAAMSEVDAADELRSILSSSCELRMRSDVPVGISLSGGVDSAAIAATVAPRASSLVGYSFGNPADRQSEGPLVALLAARLGVRPRYVSVHDAGGVRELFWRTLDAQDAPFPHASVMAQHAVFRAAHQDGVSVLLGGQGGDEAFMGYRKYFLFYAQELLRSRRLSRIPEFLAATLPLVPAVALRARLFFSERKRYASSAGGMGSLLAFPGANAHETGMGLAPGGTAVERQALDVTRFSLPTLLRYEDRNSMGNSVESRLPFLDHRIIEFGIALPLKYKIRNGYGKWALRQSMRSRVPNAVLFNRDKRGFDVNQRSWLAAGLADELRTALSARRAAVTEFLPTGTRIEAAFTDDRLARDPQAFKEAVSLIWLANRL